MLKLNEFNKSNIGAGVVVRCNETGEQFTTKQVGYTMNYARDAAGRVFSDDGVTIFTRRAISSRKPVTLYISGVRQGADVTGWKGDVHGKVVAHTSWTRWSIYGSYDMHSVQVRMFDGSLWRGRFGGMNECVTLKPIGA